MTIWSDHLKTVAVQQNGRLDQSKAQCQFTLPGQNYCARRAKEHYGNQTSNKQQQQQD